MTFEEHRGPIRDRTLAWVGDGNNVANSLVHAAQRFDFKLHLACPAGLAPLPRCWPGRPSGRPGCSCSRIREKRSRAPMRS